jgi:SAM-dependent methyltransferase
MALFNTDRDWEKFGQHDPYWAVLTQDRFHGAHLDQQRQAEFFENGQIVVDEMFATIDRHFDDDFEPGSALDFGCGVGRLTLALAERCDRVVGVDVAPGMLTEARKNCAAHGYDHVELVQGDDQLSRVTGAFDLLVSRIVFQHIPASRGERILERMLAMLNPGGIGSLHFYCGHRTDLEGQPAAGWKNLLCSLRAGWRSTLARIRGQAVMEMHAYDLNRILMRLKAVGCRDIYCRLLEQGECFAATVYFRR